MKKQILLLLLLLGLKVLGSHDKYRLILRDNPSTTITIGWNQISGNSVRVYYGTTDFGTNYNNYPYSKTPDRSVGFKGMNNTFLRLTGLEPNTAYYFVIKDNQQASRRFWFKTAPAGTNRLSFIAGGDSRNNRTPRKNANLLVSKLKPHAVLFGGDMTDSDSSSQWQTWFNDWQLTIAEDGRMFPIIATRGNHEDGNTSIYNLFDTPSSNVYYALTFGNNFVRTYTLNTEISISGNQTTWLANDLTINNDVIWKIAQYHKPMRPHVSYKSEGNNQYNNWAGLFYDHGVQLVVECDAHTVKTTWPVRPSSGSGSDQGFIRDDDRGTVYIGEGCWGAPLRSNNDRKDWTRNSGSFNQFKWIFVDKDKIETRTIKTYNASQVQEVSNNDVFQIPNNLDIWKPSNGGVVIINKRVIDPDPGSKTLEIAVSNGIDDVEEDKNGNIYENSSDLELVYDSYNNSSYQTIGLRFRSVNIPKKATITRAYLQFTADESHSTGASLEITLHNSLDSPVFSDSNNVSGRSTFKPKVIWNPLPWTKNQSMDVQRSPDLKEMIQLLVNKEGWIPGNSLSFSIKGKGNSLTNTNAKRVAESYESGAGLAPRLIVTFATNTSTDICAGIDPWQSNANYVTGQKVTYNGFLYKKTNSGWEWIGQCGINKNGVSVNKKKVPPFENEKTSFLVTPNPFEDTISIMRSGLESKENQNFFIHIHNLAGKLIYEKNVNMKGNFFKIDPKIDDFGIYLLSIRDENNLLICTKQVLKQ